MESAAIPPSPDHSQLARCRFGVVVVMIVAALLALGNAIDGAFRLRAAVRSPFDLGDNGALVPLQGFDRSFRDHQLYYGLRRLFTAAALTTLAIFLFRYSRRLHQAAAGRINLDQVLGAQAACWLIAAVLAVGYFVGQWVVW